MKKNLLAGLATGLFILAMTGMASADPITYFGDSKGGMSGTASTPSVARGNFLIDLDTGEYSYGIEDFSALENGKLNFGAYSSIGDITASIVGGFHKRNANWNNMAKDKLVITFDSNIVAWGTDIADLGDNYNGLNIEIGFKDISTNTYSLIGRYNLDNKRTSYTNDQSNFWGIVSDSEFNTIIFDLTSIDWYELDNMVAAINSTPVPSLEELVELLEKMLTSGEIAGPGNSAQGITKDLKYPIEEATIVLAQEEPDYYYIISMLHEFINMVSAQTCNSNQGNGRCNGKKISTEAGSELIGYAESLVEQYNKLL